MNVLRWSALVATVWLVYNMVVIWAWWGGVNATEGIVGTLQVVVLVGFVYLLLFDLGSAVWILARSCWGRTDGQEACEAGWLLVLAVMALVGLAGGKGMGDEIAREQPLGRAGGEWGILYILLTVQLAYGLGVLVKGQERTRSGTAAHPAVG